MNKYFAVIIFLTLMLSCKQDRKIETFTIAFGSCNNQSISEQPIWDKVLSHDPDLWIWLGDIIYADTEDMMQMKADYDLQKSYPDYQKLVRSTEVIGIWDDHDYGANNSGKDYPQKEKSKELLFSFLEVSKEDDAWDRPGTYQTYEYSLASYKIKVILLDVRFFRDEPGPDNTIIGEEQWTWFENQLETSDADIHIIGGGSQFLPEDHRFEKWANYPKDRARLIEVIGQYDIAYPILISGDRHLAEMSLVTDSDGDPILEVTSSGLTHSYRGFTEEANRHRVGGEVVSEKNFGMITISAGEQLGYTTALYDDKNVKQYQLEDTDVMKLTK